MALSLSPKVPGPVILVLHCASVGLDTEDLNVKKFKRMGFEKNANFMSRKL